MADPLEHPTGEFEWGPDRPWMRPQFSMLLIAVGAALLTLGIAMSWP